MKRLALVAVAVAAFAGTLTATASENTTNAGGTIARSTIKQPPPPARCLLPAFRPFSRAVWDPDLWARGKPAKKAIRAQRSRLRCAPPGHRRAMQRRWRRDQDRFFAERRRQLANWCSPTPHPEGDGCWEIPAWCVAAESGGSWTAHNPTSPARGPYQLLGHGEPWPVESKADAEEHHRIAASLYAASGLGPWVAC